MKKLFKIIIPIGILILCYLLFEPIFIHNFGRTEMPILDDIQTKTIYSDAKKLRAD